MCIERNHTYIFLEQAKAFDCCSSYWSRNKALRHEQNIIFHCTYLRCEASCRTVTWYKFNQFRVRKEVQYFLIPRSLRGASPLSRSTHRALPWTRLGPRRSQGPSPRSAPPNVKSWIRTWNIFLPKKFHFITITQTYRMEFPTLHPHSASA